jgi:hypothetical protein
VTGPHNLVVYLEYKREREFTRGKNRLKILVGYKFGGFDSSSISEPERKNPDELFREDFIPIFGEEAGALGTSDRSQGSKINQANRRSRYRELSEGNRNLRRQYWARKIELTCKRAA